MRKTKSEQPVSYFLSRRTFYFLDKKTAHRKRFRNFFKRLLSSIKSNKALFSTSTSLINALSLSVTLDDELNNLFSEQQRAEKQLMTPITIASDDAMEALSYVMSHKEHILTLSIDYLLGSSR